jgi:hypothetical protein
MDHLPTPRRGVTLLELIIVIGAVLMLATLLLPAVAKARQAADRTHSINNLKQMGIAMHNFHDVFRRLPPMVGRMGNQDGSAHFHLLPYMEQLNVYREARGNSWQVANQVIPTYIDPDDKSLPMHLHVGAIATTNYAGNWLGFKDGTNRFPAAFQDGTSNTMAFATRYQLCNGTPTAWAYSAISAWTPMFGYYSHAKFQVNPKQEDCNPHVPQAIGTVMIVGMFDGSARPLNENISPLTWHAATTPAGGEILGGDWQ